LIARQRANLRRTFAYLDENQIDEPAAKRLSTTEQELVAATTEFTDGLEQRVGPVPCLRDAITAMEAATEALASRRVKPALEHEETALANLIKARENLRQLLKQSKSSSQVRKFDQQQRQKLRTPAPKNAKKDQPKLEQELEKLAQEEKEFAQEACAQNASSSSSGESSSKERQEKLTAQQDKAASKAAELKGQMEKDEALTRLARERMASATENIKESAGAMRQGLEQNAGQKAAEAAAQLERLAKQVAALKTRELEQRLAKAQQQARDLAKTQEAFANKPGPKSSGEKSGTQQAEEQRGQSEEAKSLGDLLAKTQKDAAENDAKLGQALRQATETASPAGIAAQIERAAQALQDDKSEQARADAQQAAQMLDQLAQQLDAIQRALIQPQLEKLMAAEKQAAQTQKALQTAKTEQQKGEAERKMTDLRKTMDDMAGKNEQMSQAAQALDKAIQHGGAGWTRRERAEPPQSDQYFIPPKVYDDSVQQVVKSLQARIQELILKEVLLDKDEAVPPKYKKLVEEYYRVLSEDAR
jgi:hypothetical protein